jgi:exodeoxyribonuclease-3
MRIFSWNVNGLRSVVNKGAFAEFVTRYDPDIICLQETKARPGQAVIDLPEYEEFWNSADRAGYSGTAIFSRIKPRDVTTNFAAVELNKYNFTDRYGDVTREGRVTTAEFADFYLVTVYTPNAKDDLTRLGLREKVWDPAFLDYVRGLNLIKPVIFCGDLNVAATEIDLARPNENRGKHGFTDEERAGFANYLKAGFVDTFRAAHPADTTAYTWWSHWSNARARNIGWRIDYFLISSVLAKKVTAAEIHPEQIGSDHCPISITLDART